MIDRSQVETILKIHGISPSAPDEEIRSILYTAKYTNDEIDTALTVIRQDSTTKLDRVEGMQRIYRADQRLTPKQISALLGIEVTVEAVDHKKVREPETSLLQMAVFVFLTLFFAGAGLLVALYASESGPFHPTVSAFSL